MEGELLELAAVGVVDVHLVAQDQRIGGSWPWNMILRVSGTQRRELPSVRWLSGSWSSISSAEALRKYQALLWPET